MPNLICLEGIKLFKSIASKLLLVLVMLVTLSAFASAWYNTSFTYFKTITLNSTSPENLVDFPVPVTMDTASLISASKLQNDCDDIRVVNSTDGLMDYEVEACNYAASIIWVRIPSFLANTTTTIYVYYGDATAANAENAYHVWRNNFVSVYHGDGLTDSRSLNDVTAAGGGIIAMNTSCKFGYCFMFGNNSVYWLKETPTGFPADTSLAPTLSGWGITATNGTTAVVLAAQGDHVGGKQRSIYFNMDAGELWGDVYGTAHNPDMKVNPGLGTMVFYAVAYINSTCGHYIYQNLNNLRENIASCSVNNAHLRIGSNLENTNKWGENSAPAYIDEVRFSNTTRSSGWLAAEFNTSAVLGAETTSYQPNITNISITPLYAYDNTTIGCNV